MQLNMHFLLSPKEDRVLLGIAELAADASIYADVQVTGEIVSCIRIGHYMPRGTIRFPVFFGMATYDGDIDAVINYLLSRDEPAIMLLPSIEDVPQAKLNAVKSKGSGLIGLQDLQADSILIDIAKVDEAFKAFFEVQKDPDPKINCKIFPTPPGATWGKFIFEWQEEQLLNEARTKKEHKREILMITCGTETLRYEPDDLNMLDQRSKTQNKQWALLGIFIKNNGILDWQNSEAKDTLKKQKQELIKKLKKAFSQTDDPIQWDDDEKCYKCKFVCRHDQQNQ